MTPFSFYLSIAVLLAGLTKPGEVGEILALYRLKSLSLDYKAKLKYGYSNFINAVKRQRNLGLKFAVILSYQQIKPSLLEESRTRQTSANLY
jgi:hypothetical protein